MCGEIQQPKQAEAEVHNIDDGGQPSCEQKGSENGRLKKWDVKGVYLKWLKKVLSLHSGSTLKPERNRILAPKSRNTPSLGYHAVCRYGSTGGWGEQMINIYKE